MGPKENSTGAAFAKEKGDCFKNEVGILVRDIGNIMMVRDMGRYYRRHWASYFRGRMTSTMIWITTSGDLPLRPLLRF